MYILVVWYHVLEYYLYLKVKSLNSNNTIPANHYLLFGEIQIQSHNQSYKTQIHSLKQLVTIYYFDIYLREIIFPHPNVLFLD